MEKLKASHNVTVVWHSFELRPADGPPLPPDYIAKVKANRPRMYAMAKENYGIDMKPGPFGIDSRPALAGAKYAEAHGVGDAYHDTIFHEYWLAERNIEDREVLQEIAVSVGLDAADFASALEAEPYRAAVLADIKQARDYGLSGVPAMIFDNKYLVSGAQPYDVLVEVVEKIEAEEPHEN